MIHILDRGEIAHVTIARFQRRVEEVAQSAVGHRTEHHETCGLIEQLLQLLLRFRPHAQFFERVNRGLRGMKMEHRLFAGFDALGLQFTP